MLVLLLRLYYTHREESTASDGKSGNNPDGPMIPDPMIPADIRQTAVIFCSGRPVFASHLQILAT